MTRSVAPPGLDIRVARDYATMSKQAADVIATELETKPDLLLCASAGGTPMQMYKCLAAEFSRRPGLFSKLRVIQIDEWVGLPRAGAGTCEADLRENLLSPLQVGSDRFIGFPSDAPEPEVECERISQWLAAKGPIDICVLGLGLNGHIAMNEPASAVQPRAHVARLAPSSRCHPMLKSATRKPRCGMTLGLGEILPSRKVFLLVSGSKKRAALRRLLTPKVTSRFPASFLWLHPNATLFCDREAADEL